MGNNSETIYTTPVDVYSQAASTGGKTWQDAFPIPVLTTGGAYTINGSLSGNHTENWYKLTPESSATYRFSIDPEYSVQSYIAGTDGAPATIGNYSGVCNLDAEAGKTYYIRVHSTSDNTGIYTLTIRVPLSTDGRSFVVGLGGNKYYADFRDGGKLYRSSSDYTNAVKLSDTKITWLAGAGQTLYFNADGKLRSLNIVTQTETETELLPVNAFYIVTDGTNLYYSNWSDSGKIYRYEIATGTNTLVCHDEGAYLSLTETDITYQNGYDNCRIHKVPKTALNVSTGTLIQ